MAAGFMKVKAGDKRRNPEMPAFAAGAAPPQPLIPPLAPPFGLLEERLHEGFGRRRKPDPILHVTFRRHRVTHAHPR